MDATVQTPGDSCPNTSRSHPRVNPGPPTPLLRAWGVGWVRAWMK